MQQNQANCSQSHVCKVGITMPSNKTNRHQRNGKKGEHHSHPSARRSNQPPLPSLAHSTHVLCTANRFFDLLTPVLPTCYRYRCLFHQTRNLECPDFVVFLWRIRTCAATARNRMRTYLREESAHNSPVGEFPAGEGLECRRGGLRGLETDENLQSTEVSNSPRKCSDYGNKPFRHQPSVSNRR